MLSSISNSSYDMNGGDNPSEDPNTKKVQFKESEMHPEDVMLVESSSTPYLS